MPDLSRPLWACVVPLLLLAAVVMSDPALAQNTRPMKMSEVSRLINRDQSPQDVLEQMAERGVSFRMSAAAEGRLEKFGFTDDQIAIVRRIAAGEEVDLGGDSSDADATDADADADDMDDADGPGLEGDADGPADGDLGVGFPNPKAWHDAEQARLERAMKDSGLGYERVELSRITLYSSERRARKVVPVLKKLEASLIKHFPPSIANACSPQSTHVILVDDYAWERWVNALVGSYEADGITFSFGGNQDTRQQMLQTPSFLLPTCAVMREDSQRDDESVARFASYVLGHLMMERAGGQEQPAGLTTGFGDLAEQMAMGTPSVMIYSQEYAGGGGPDRGQNQSWPAMVKKQFEDRRITNPMHVWSYETSSMEPEHYAECWSMVLMLSKEPEKFAEVVRMVREEGKAMPEAVRAVYDMEDKEMLKAWYKSVQ